jgi:hypothetical protein
MFILPYLYHKSQLGNMVVHEWNLLTIAGVKLWKEDDHLQIKEDILNPNGFILRSEPRMNASVLFCELDQSRLNMEDYYSWEELTVEELSDEDIFCWRRFYVFGPADDNRPISHAQWLPTPDTQLLDPIPCQDIFQYLLQLHQLPHTTV